MWPQQQHICIYRLLFGSTYFGEATKTEYPESLLHTCAQLQSADRVPAQHFKDSRPVNPAQHTGAKGAYQRLTGEGGEKAEKLAANHHLGGCCLLNAEAWKSECQTRQVRLLKQATWIQHGAYNKHVLGALLHNGYRDLDSYDDPRPWRSLKLSALVLRLWLSASHWHSPPPTQACSAAIVPGFVCQGHLILQRICWHLHKTFTWWMYSMNPKKENGKIIMGGQSQ